MSKRTPIPVPGLITLVAYRMREQGATVTEIADVLGADCATTEKYIFQFAHFQGCLANAAPHDARRKRLYEVIFSAARAKPIQNYGPLSNKKRVYPFFDNAEVRRLWNEDRSAFIRASRLSFDIPPQNLRKQRERGKVVGLNENEKVVHYLISSVKAANPGAWAMFEKRCNRKKL